MSTEPIDLNGASEYEIRIDAHAKRDLRRVPRAEFARLDDRICSLGQNPRPMGVLKLRDSVHRIRVGPWRVIYLIDDANRVVLINAVRRRDKDTYRERQ